MSRFNSVKERLGQVPVAKVYGRLTRMKGLVLEATGCQLSTGQRCSILTARGRQFEAEVVGFNDDRHYLMPLAMPEGVGPGDRVMPLAEDSSIPVGDELLGRVLNGLGEPLDEAGKINCTEMISLNPEPINPLSRQPVKQILDVGVRAINGMLAVGQGQRMGLFAGSGVGKSVLLGMMTRNTGADVVIVGMIGERGREVREFIEHTLGPEGLKKAIVVAAPADESPVMRLRAALVCHRLAEYYRDRGKSVLLLMDSLTRYAQAQREIALSVGEAPATRGYAPSVFSHIARLLERAGNGAANQGAITAFYTVLVEGDDMLDPIADSARSVLDGHIVLTRELADSGHYPAIDIEKSISRVMPLVVSEEHMNCVHKLKALHSQYNEAKELMAIGAYQRGSDPELDLAIEVYPAIKGYLQQGVYEQIGLEACLNQLMSIWGHLKKAAVSPDRTVTA
ncbi:flagellar protein export ATPase FliI [Endozoicomonas sp. Mp262]